MAAFPVIDVEENQVYGKNGEFSTIRHKLMF